MYLRHFDFEFITVCGNVLYLSEGCLDHGILALFSSSGLFQSFYFQGEVTIVQVKLCKRNLGPLEAPTNPRSQISFAQLNLNDGYLSLKIKTLKKSRA
jgi:hypothetical protein